MQPRERYAFCLLICLAALFSAAWFQANPGASPQTFGSAGQRDEMVTELKRLNQSVEALQKLFATGQARVLVVGVEAKAGSASPAKPDGDAKSNPAQPSSPAKPRIGP